MSTHREPGALKTGGGYPSMLWLPSRAPEKGSKALRVPQRQGGGLQGASEGTRDQERRIRCTRGEPKSR